MNNNRKIMFINNNNNDKVSRAGFEQAMYQYNSVLVVVRGNTHQ